MSPDPYIFAPDDNRLCVFVRPGMPLPDGLLVACSDPWTGDAAVGYLASAVRRVDGVVGFLIIRDAQGVSKGVYTPKHLRVIYPSLARLRVGQRVRHHRKGTIYVITSLLNRRSTDPARFPPEVAYVEEGGDPAESWCKPVDRFFATMLPVDMKE